MMNSNPTTPGDFPDKSHSFEDSKNNDQPISQSSNEFLADFVIASDMILFIKRSRFKHSDEFFDVKGSCVDDFSVGELSDK